MDFVKITADVQGEKVKLFVHERQSCRALKLLRDIHLVGSSDYKLTVTTRKVRIDKKKAKVNSRRRSPGAILQGLTEQSFVLLYYMQRRMNRQAA